MAHLNGFSSTHQTAPPYKQFFSECCCVSWKFTTGQPAFSVFLPPAHHMGFCPAQLPIREGHMPSHTAHIGMSSFTTETSRHGSPSAIYCCQPFTWYSPAQVPHWHTAGMKGKRVTTNHHTSCLFLFISEHTRPLTRHANCCSL